MAIDKSKYRIIEDGGKEFILASQASEYAKEHFNSQFRIPTYRTIRDHVTKGILERPQRMGKETFFEIDYLMGVIAIIRLISATWDPTIQQLRKVVTNARRRDQLKETLELIRSAMGKFGNPEASAAFIEELCEKSPKDIKVADIIKRYPEE